MNTERNDNTSAVKSMKRDKHKVSYLCISNQITAGVYTETMLELNKLAFQPWSPWHQQL